MNASSSNVRSSSNSASTNSLRPRARRLISGLGEDESDGGLSQIGRSASPIPALHNSRSASPIPAAHPSRPSTSHRRGDHGASFGSFWDSSWSTLQGLASDLIGSDISTPDNARTRNRASRKPAGTLRSTKAPLSASQEQWGPLASKSQLSTMDIGAGTKEEQLAMLRAERRRAMLMQQESSYADTLGKFKRRSSDDRPSASAPPAENEGRDALVYVHQVQKHDTLAGITIKYNCNAATLRKANRMWPNDTAITKDIVLIPVDACAVKGRRVAGPEQVDLLGEESEALSAGQAEEVTSNHESRVNGAMLDGTGRSRALSTSTRNSSVTTDVSWQHDSWVLLPGSTKPTQIGRIPRRAIGYFPPARRKSNAFSDMDTPTASLELSRSESTQAELAAPTSNPSHSRHASNNRIPTYLTGPGGVGTLSRNVHVPGPGEDGLNKYFAKHLPDVAPPKYHQTLLAPEMPMYTDDDIQPPGSGTATPNTSKHKGFVNMGGQIEAWARRMASATQGALQSPGRQKLARASVGTPGRGVGGIGDLIEMTDEFALGDEEEEDELGRGREHHAENGQEVTDDYFATRASRNRPLGDSGKRGKAD